MRKSNGSICAIDGCDSPAKSRGWCFKHYKRWQLYGDPTVLHTKRSVPVEERFWSKVDKAGPRAEGMKEPCWIWLAAKRGPYGTIGVNGSSRPAHRVAYELCVGPIPFNLELDHLCRVKACVNPAHLEPVTHAENLARAGNSFWGSRTHCKWGHEYTPENTLMRHGARVCRACKRRNWSSWYWQKRAEAQAHQNLIG